MFETDGQKKFKANLKETCWRVNAPSNNSNDSISVIYYKNNPRRVIYYSNHSSSVI